MSDLNVISFIPEGPAEGLQDWPEQAAENLLTAPPKEQGHEFFVDPTGKLTAGVWTATPFQEKSGPYPVDEFMQLLEGNIIIVYEDGSEDVFNPGDCFVIPKGTVCSWKQDSTVRKFYLIFDNAEPLKPLENQRAIRIDTDSKLPALSNLDAARFTGGIPNMSQDNIYTDSTGQWLVGQWEASALELVPATIQRSEFAHILQGEAEVVNGDGVVFRASQGDSLLVPIGMGYQWRQAGKVRKVFCSLTPKS